MRYNFQFSEAYYSRKATSRIIQKCRKLRIPAQKKRRVIKASEASYRRYCNKKISTTFTLAGILAASSQISYFLRRDCILRKREGRFSTSLFVPDPLSLKYCDTLRYIDIQDGVMVVYMYTACLFFIYRITLTTSQNWITIS